MGAHISFVRSCVLDDRWTPEQVAVMEKVGNEVANLYWEANLPPNFVRPKTKDIEALGKFIRDKYEAKKYAADDRLPPHQQTIAQIEELQKQRPSIMESKSDMLTPQVPPTPPPPPSKQKNEQLARRVGKRNHLYKSNSQMQFDTSGTDLFDLVYRQKPVRAPVSFNPFDLNSSDAYPSQ